MYARVVSLLPRGDASNLLLKERRREYDPCRRPLNMQKWTCAATCDNGKQQRVFRVQTPRHFVHPWIICGAMSNASTAAHCGEPFNMHAPAGCSYIRAGTVHSHRKNYRPPSTNPPLPVIVARVRMTITYVPGFKECPLHTIFFPISFYIPLSAICMFESTIVASLIFQRSVYSSDLCWKVQLHHILRQI